MLKIISFQEETRFPNIETLLFGTGKEVTILLVRVLPYLTSQKISNFDSLPFLSLSQISCFCSLRLLLGIPSSLECGRHIWKLPKQT